MIRDSQTHCSLGEGCSHVAAILFKVEAAVRNGHTTTTSNACQWNQVFTTKVCMYTVHAWFTAQCLYTTQYHM